ncbi:hypothetical protein GCM10018793_22420 [Streptomyces sulfonofaciens]|uniref:Uncharacterized protein n=1 Tax=Streptomyces sulfonofaciens TaxID=68272 RepID=A0A919KXK3_9ACTN|nr:hypothetical protein GCM10018793_22420 [Streptomyces sulfonofaciens]
MAHGGFCKLPSGSVVVALTLPRPTAEAAKAPGAAAYHDGAPGSAATGATPPGGSTPGGERGTVRVLVHAANRSRALTRLRNLGLRSVYLRGNSHPPTPDEVTAVLHHPDGLIWRTAPLRPNELWHPIKALFARPGPDVPAGGNLASAPARGPAPGSVLAALPGYAPESPLTVPEAWTAGAP